MNNILNKIHLIYLCLLPSVATYFLLQGLDKVDWVGIPIFLIGTAVVGVYISYIASYTPNTKNSFFLLIMIIDAPVFSLIANLNFINFANIATETFLIENMAIWISIGILALTSGRPTRGQLVASVILAILCVGSIFLLYYSAGFFVKDWYLYIPLLFGALEALWIKYKVLYKDEVLRGPYDAAGFIVFFIFLWIISLILGGIVSNG